MDEHGKNLPEVFDKVLTVRAYNSLTGANLSHWDLDRLGIFEYDDVMLVLANGDLLR